MGQSIRISCRECDSSWEVKTGHGLIHGTKEKVLEEFPESLKGKAKDAYKDGRFPYFSFKPAICEKCRAYVSVPVPSDNVSGEIAVAGFCPVCKNKNVKIQKKPEENPCPFCGAVDLIVTSAGDWD